MYTGIYIFGYTYVLITKFEKKADPHGDGFKKMWFILTKFYNEKDIKTEYLKDIRFEFYKP